MSIEMSNTGKNAMEEVDENVFDLDMKESIDTSTSQPQAFYNTPVTCTTTFICCCP